MKSSAKKEVLNYVTPDKFLKHGKMNRQKDFDPIFLHDEISNHLIVYYLYVYNSSNGFCKVTDLNFSSWHRCLNFLYCATSRLAFRLTTVNINIARNQHWVYLTALYITNDLAFLLLYAYFALLFQRLL